MSLLEKLCPKKGSRQRSKRVGRGDGSGKGGTAAKGHKGQIARTGGRVRWGFEGGQTPIMRRLPKFGFSNAAFANKFQIVNLSTLERFDGEVNPDTLVGAGVVKKLPLRIKILGHGKLTKALKVRAHQFSKSAEKSIQAAGGSTEVI